jgi:hypothetical protein
VPRTSRAWSVVVVLLALSAPPVLAQQRPGQAPPVPGQERPAPERRAAEREHFQLKFGPSYDEGDFGTRQTTRTFFFPVTFRYLGEHFDIGLTGSFIHLEAPRDVVIVEGQPQRTGRERGGRESVSGIGDLILRGRYYLVDDPGPDSWVPTLAPFVKLKIPTADADRGLGTGEVDGGFGVEFDKTIGDFLVFGDVSYTFIGDPPGQDFRNRPAASLGLGYYVTRDILVGGLIDWRRALVRGNEDPVELVGLATFRLARTSSVTPHAFVGLTHGSPDWGIGVEVSWKFGRW